MKADTYFENIKEIDGKKAELKRISGKRVTGIDDGLNKGIDGVYENTYPPPKFVINETKYAGGQLNPNTRDGPQMSDAWIRNRLEKAVGVDKADEILTNPYGYDRVLTNISNTGNVSTSAIDAGGNVIGNWP